MLLCSLTLGLAELTVDVKPTSVLVKRGSVVMIDCKASGTAKAVTVTWSLDGLAVENTEERKVLPNNTLYITNLRGAYKGSYVCEAKVDSTESKSVVVKVDIAGKVVLNITTYLYICS